MGCSNLCPNVQGAMMLFVHPREEKHEKGHARAGEER